MVYLAFALICHDLTPQSVGLVLSVEALTDAHLGGHGESSSVGAVELKPDNAKRLLVGIPETSLIIKLVN